MASMSVYDSDVFDDLWNINFGDVSIEALNEAAPILEKKIKANARVAIIHDGDSAMVNSIKQSTAKRAKNGAYIVNVGPRGYSDHQYYAKNGKGVKTKRKYKVSNALKAIWKEYGIPNQQPAQPFISTAVSQCENEVQNVLQRKFEEKLK